ncbi:lamin tail domain-containing protein 2 isoform X2 [Kogia breviceps]|uniref:lamin tail domain-containing protein 2 isoform X2 n=1 Tax=Kogia breviceps TaxID=27615 RepID=UPI0034D36ED2
MAPESCQEAEDAEEEAFPSLVDRELVSGHVGPPASTSADSGAPACPQDTKPSSTRMVSSVNPQSSCSRKLLQNQVQKLTLELEEQKEQAQLEKAHLEEWLLQTGDTLRQLEAELQALQKSCLLQLARSSWVGRMLQSSTGSVEVVTAETLMDPSDLSENDQSPTAGEGFRLEDVDWNSIAHRYPNLFTNLESSSDQKPPRAPPLPEFPPATQPERRNSGLYCRQRRHRLKSVEWRCPPLVGNSSSRGTDSEASSCLLAARYHTQKVTGDPPQAPGHIAEQTEAQAQSLCGDSRATSEGCLSLDLRKTHSDRQGKNGQEPESRADPHPRHSGRCPSRWRRRPIWVASCCSSWCATSPCACTASRPARCWSQGTTSRCALLPAALAAPPRTPPPPPLVPHPPPTPSPGVGRGAPQHQAADTLLLGPGARPLPLQPGLRDPPPEPPRRGPQQAPGRALRDPRVQDLRRQHRLVHRPFPALRGPALRRPRGTAAPASTPAQGSGAGGPGRAPAAGVGTSGPSVRTSSPGPDSTKTPYALLGLSPHLPRARPCQDHPSAIQDSPPVLHLPWLRPLRNHPFPRTGSSLTTTLAALPRRTRVQLPRLSTRKLLRQREEPARPEGAAETLPELLPASRIPIPGAPEERGPRLSDGGAVGAEHGREQVRLPLPQLPAHHRGLALAGVGPGRAAAPAPVLPRLHDRGCGAGRGGEKAPEAGGASYIVY